MWSEDNFVASICELLYSNNIRLSNNIHCFRSHAFSIYFFYEFKISLFNCIVFKKLNNKTDKTDRKQWTNRRIFNWILIPSIKKLIIRGELENLQLKMLNDFFMISFYISISIKPSLIKIFFASIQYTAWRRRWWCLSRST